jgi:hypothetical protein
MVGELSPIIRRRGEPQIVAASVQAIVQALPMEVNRSEAIRRLLDEDPEIKPAQAKAILAGDGITISSALFRMVRAAWRPVRAKRAEAQAKRAEARRRAEQQQKEREEQWHRDREDDRKKAAEKLRQLACWLSVEQQEQEYFGDWPMEYRFDVALASEAGWISFRNDLIGGWWANWRPKEMPSLEPLLKAGIYPGLADRLPDALASQEEWVRLRDDLISGRFDPDEQTSGVKKKE